MAEWVTHLMVADNVLERCPWLHRRGFCVGNIAPDCNVENEDWTQFTPPREVTHWMQGGRKNAADCEPFYEAYVLRRGEEISGEEHFSFLLGYYAHLITDAEFQRTIRDEKRVAAVWRRIDLDPVLGPACAGLPRTWDEVKKLIPRGERYREILALEAEYLEQNPSSGFLTEILPLKSFPDYLDYLPEGAIPRKIGVMGHMPAKGNGSEKYIGFSREEYRRFVENAATLVLEQLGKKGAEEMARSLKEQFPGATLLAGPARDMVE